MAVAPSIPYPWNIVHVYVADLSNDPYRADQYHGRGGMACIWKLG